MDTNFYQPRDGIPQATNIPLSRKASVRTVGQLVDLLVDSNVFTPQKQQFTFMVRKITKKHSTDKNGDPLCRWPKLPLSKKVRMMSEVADVIPALKIFEENWGAELACMLSVNNRCQNFKRRPRKWYINAQAHEIDGKTIICYQLPPMLIIRSPTTQ